MKPIINFFNWLSDLDWGWWPFLKHRPEKHERMEPRLILRMTPFYGTILGLTFLLIVDETPDPVWLPVIFGVAWLGYFLISLVIMVAPWNIRAREINQGHQKADS